MSPASLIAIRRAFSADPASGFRALAARAHRLASRLAAVIASDHLGLRLGAAALLVGSVACAVWSATGILAAL